MRFALLKQTFFLFILSLVLFSCESKTNRVEQKKATNLYTTIIYQIGKGNINQEEKVKRLKKLVLGLSPSYRALEQISSAYLLQMKGSYEIANTKTLVAISLLKKEPVDTLIGTCNKQIALYYKNKSDLPLALKYFQKALSNFKNGSNIRLEAATLASIGQLYFDIENVIDARKYCEKAIFILGKKKNNDGYLRAAHTLANIHGMSGNFAKALKIDNECLVICSKMKSKSAAVTFLDNKANCFMYSNRLDSAEFYFRKCLEIDQQIGIKKQIADSYSNLGNLYFFRNDFKQAESYLQKSIAIAEDIKHFPGKLKSLTILKSVLSSKNEKDRVIETHEEYQKAYKQFISDKNESALAEFQVVYDTQNKEKLLALEVAKSRKKSILLIFCGFAVLIAFLLFRQQRLKVKQEAIKAKIKQELQEEKSMAKLQEQRLDISRELHDSVGSKLTFISSVVDNLKNDASLSSEVRDKKLVSLANYAETSITELRDTIWVLNTKNLTINELINRIAELVRDAKDSTEKVSFSFNTSNENNVQLTSKEGMNLYRVVQEMVNNALKYAEATLIQIDVLEKNNAIELSVIDNGIGFDLEAKKNVSYGLQNIRIRMEEIKATYKLTSQVGKGTQILINLNTSIHA